jgi:hypothetical protein
MFYAAFRYFLGAFSKMKISLFPLNISLAEGRQRE